MRESDPTPPGRTPGRHPDRAGVGTVISPELGVVIGLLWLGGILVVALLLFAHGKREETERPDPPERML